MSTTSESSKGKRARLTIGMVSERTGIPVETLRTWERRYRFPSPERNAAGHRRYRQQTVEQLQLASELLEMGMQASEVLSLPAEAMREQLQQLRSVQGRPDQLRSEEPEEVIESWIDASRRFDALQLEEELRALWYRVGAIDFVSRYCGPFLHRVGEAWASGEISVRHEHFVSEQLRDFLSRQWRSLSSRAVGVTVVCAVLPTERHVLGLHMAAAVIALAGHRVIFLGADTPLEDILETIHENEARLLLLSVSQSADTQTTTDALRRLRRALPEGLEVIVGGLGAPRSVEEVERIEDFGLLSQRAFELFRQQEA